MIANVFSGLCAGASVLVGAIFGPAAFAAFLATACVATYAAQGVAAK